VPEAGSDEQHRVLSCRVSLDPVEVHLAAKHLTELVSAHGRGRRVILGHEIAPPRAVLT
jgi:hypothetical protein